MHQLEAPTTTPVVPVRELFQVYRNNFKIPHSISEAGQASRDFLSLLGCLTLGALGLAGLIGCGAIAEGVVDALRK